MNSVFFVATSEGALFYYNPEKALKVISNLIGEDIKLTVGIMPLESFTKLIGVFPKPEPVQPVKQPTNGNGKHPVMIKSKKIVKQSRKKEGRAGYGDKTKSVLEALSGRTEKEALFSRDIARLTGRSVSVISEPLVRLFRTGKIRRTHFKPWKYYGAGKPKTSAKTQIPAKIICAARDGIVIDFDKCVPNENHPKCKHCAWLPTKASA